MVRSRVVQLAVEPEIFDLFPGMTLAVAVAHDLSNSGDETVDAEWRQAWAEAGRAGEAYPNAQSHPRVRPWRERLRSAGISSKEFPCSIEAMLRRAIKGGAPFTINPLVDFYNTVAMRHVVPAGGWDLDEVGDIALRRARSGDAFHSLDAEEPVAVEPGEIAYATGSTVLTRHFVWRQSVEGLITPATRNVLLVSEILGEVGRDVAERVLADFQEGLRRHFGVESEGVLLNAERVTATFT